MKSIAVLSFDEPAGHFHGNLEYLEIQPNGYLDHVEGVREAVTEFLGTETSVLHQELAFDGGLWITLKAEGFENILATVAESQLQ
jgi:hypothetical protein